VGEQKIGIRVSAMAGSFIVTTTSSVTQGYVAMIVAADSAGRLAPISQTLRRHIPEDGCLHRHNITLQAGILVRTRELGTDCVVIGLLE